MPGLVPSCENTGWPARLASAMPAARCGSFVICTQSTSTVEQMKVELSNPAERTLRHVGRLATNPGKMWNFLPGHQAGLRAINRGERLFDIRQVAFHLHNPYCQNKRSGSRCDAMHPIARQLGLAKLSKSARVPGCARPPAQALCVA